MGLVSTTLAEQVADLEERIVELERENEILRSERDDEEDEPLDSSIEEDLCELEAVELLRELRGHLKSSTPTCVAEWSAHFELLLHRANALIEEYDALRPWFATTRNVHGR